MNIIFFSENSKKSLKFYLGPLACVTLAAVCLCLGVVVFYAGYQYAVGQSKEIVFKVKEQTKTVWQTELEDELVSVQQVKNKAEKSINAMAGRLSLLQGHVMRLDALGSRLATMAHLEDIEFGVENPPGMGGPGPADGGIPQEIPHFLDQLTQLEESLLDRQDKLLAMESMLIDRSLQEQTSPEGVPAEGGWLSSVYGYRTDPMTGSKEFHQGMDFAGKPGTPITAVAAGIVTWSGIRYGYGKLVEINHGNGYITRYAHNLKNLVTVGEKIEKGEVIALMGNSGRSTGTHVHFEVLKDGKHLNPKRYISLR